MMSKMIVKIWSSIIHRQSFTHKHISWCTKWTWNNCWSDLTEFYKTSGCTMCQRVCSTCRMQTSLQWARPASAAPAPIWTRPRTLRWAGAWCCHIRGEILNPLSNKCILLSGPTAFLYLHNYKLQHEVQCADVSWREVEHERRIPQRTGGSFGFSAADHSPFMMQSHQHLEFWRWRILKRCESKGLSRTLSL